MEIIFQSLGWIGAFGLLSAYYLNSSKRLSADTATYQWINMICATMLAINAFHIGSIPFLIINVFWAIVAVMSLVKLSKIKTVV